VNEAEEVYERTITEMSPSQKLQAFLNLYWTARELKSAGLRAQHPDWTEDRVQNEVREIFLYAAD
jgi:hypothetical protein